MRATIKCILFVFAITITSALAQPEDVIPTGSSEDDLYSKVRNSTFMICGYDGFGRGSYGGSGFFIDDAGNAVTCLHVVDNVYFIKAVMPNGEECVVDKITSCNKDYDLAVIHVDISQPKSQFLRINATNPSIGQHIVSVGAPRQNQNTFTTGKISNIDADSSGKIDRLWVDIFVTHGSSGGPVTDMNGEVLGVIKGAIYDLNYAIPAGKINSLNYIFGLIRFPKGLYNTSSENAKRYCENGDLLFIQSQFEEAATSYETAVSIDPLFSDAWSNLGAAYMNLNKNSQAINCFDQAIKLDPKCSDAWLNKGTVLFVSGSHNTGLECLDNAINIASSNKISTPSSNCYGGILYITRQDWTKFMALINKADALRILGYNQLALDCYDQATEQIPDCDFAWNAKGVALLNMSRYVSAISCFDKALELNSFSAITWNNKGIALFNTKNYLEAIECYEQSICIDSQNRDTWNNYAQALFAIGDTADGTIAIEKANELGQVKKSNPSFSALLS